MRVSNKSVGALLLLRSCITRANFRLAKLEKAEFTYRKWHFESKRNDKVALLDSFILFSVVTNLNQVVHYFFSPSKNLA